MAVAMSQPAPVLLRPLPVIGSVAGRLLSLPLHARMSYDDVALVVDCVGDSIRTAQGRAS